MTVLLLVAMRLSVVLLASCIAVLAVLTAGVSGDCIPFPSSCSDGKPAFSAGSKPVVPTGCLKVPLIPIPDDLVRELTPCCARHQTCYGSPNSFKSTCDLDFRDCMGDVCRAVDIPIRGQGIMSFFAKKDCKKWAKFVFEWTQDEAGCIAYAEAKKKYGCDVSSGGSGGGSGGDS